MKKKEVCPYCKERPIKRRTCGHPYCQHKHHVLEMRKVNKSGRIVPSRRIEL